SPSCGWCRIGESSRHWPSAPRKRPASKSSRENLAGTGPTISDKIEGRFLRIPMMYKPHFQRLESRRLLSAVYPTANEVYEVELINRARANPSAEAARFGIALNEGLPAGTISTAPKQPLAINRFITDGARKHSQWMIDNDLF